MELFHNGDIVNGSTLGTVSLVAEWNLLWWHWIALGFIALILDVLLLNVFYLLWIGLGAIFTGVALWLFPSTPFWAQILMFGFYISVLLATWLVLLRPRYIGKQLERAKRLLPGKAGIVIHYNQATNYGELRLQRPIGGKDVWVFQTTDTVRAGERVNIKAVNHDGRLLISNGGQ